MDLQSLGIPMTCRARLDQYKQGLAEQSAEIVRLKGREHQLLEVNNVDMERRRKAEQERDGWKEAARLLAVETGELGDRIAQLEEEKRELEMALDRARGAQQ